jgi:membrane protease YdiL (CAAX protease family)
LQAVSFSNPLVLAVDGARRPLPGWAALLIGFAIPALAMNFGGRLYAAAAPFLQGRTQGDAALVLDRALVFLAVLGPLALAALLLGRLYESRARPQGGMAAAPAALLGLLVGAAGFGAALGGAAALGAVQLGSAAGAGALMLLASAVLIAFQAGAEELFFRGWLQPLLSARWGPWVALAITSVLFGLAHMWGRPLSPVAAVNMTLGGVLFGLLAMRTGGLWAPFAAHWAWNWTELAVAGTTPNPGVDPLGSLFDLELVGPALLSGGADELNGALSMTVTLALLALALGVLAAPRRSEPAAARPPRTTLLFFRPPPGDAR